METYIKQISKNLIINKVEENDEIIKVFCEQPLPLGKKAHSKYIRVINDIPLGTKKVELHLTVRRIFNDDPNSDKLTVMETFDFLNDTKRRTARFDEAAITLNTFTTALDTEKIMRNTFGNISDSTILRIYKKKLQQS